jgi:uncharacterized protein (DUF433 family)
MQIEIPDELAAAVAEIAERTGQDAQSLVAEMVTEAVKLRYVPGIVFADGATGRRARVGGTGIEVFEVIGLYEAVDRNRQKLQENLPQLNPHQIDMAISYYEAYPNDIRPYLLTEEEEIAAIEAFWEANPSARPPWRRRPQDQTGTRDLTVAKSKV